MFVLSPLGPKATSSALRNVADFLGSGGFQVLLGIVGKWNSSD